MSDFVDLTTDVIAQLKRLADAFDGGDDCTDNVLDNLELIRTRLIFMSQEEKRIADALERIADALERISPATSWEIADEDWSEAQKKAREGWEPVSFSEGGYVRMRRTRQAPAAEVEEPKPFRTLP